MVIQRGKVIHPAATSLHRAQPIQLVCYDDRGQAVTLFFPLPCFDWYIALSAKSRISSGDLDSVQSVAHTPMLVVTGISPPGLAFSTADRSRSAVACASCVE